MFFWYFRGGGGLSLYSAKRAGVKQACPNYGSYVVHDAHLGHTFLFLDSLAEYTFLQ